jgi:hypothetical protein
MNRVWKMCSRGIIATNSMKHKAGVMARLVASAWCERSIAKKRPRQTAFFLKVVFVFGRCVSLSTEQKPEGSFRRQGCRQGYGGQGATAITDSGKFCNCCPARKS